MPPKKNNAKLGSVSTVHESIADVPQKKPNGKSKKGVPIKESEEVSDGLKNQKKIVNGVTTKEPIEEVHSDLQTKVKKTSQNKSKKGIVNGTAPTGMANEHNVQGKGKDTNVKKTSQKKATKDPVDEGSDMKGTRKKTGKELKSKSETDPVGEGSDMKGTRKKKGQKLESKSETDALSEDSDMTVALAKKGKKGSKSDTGSAVEEQKKETKKRTKKATEDVPKKKPKGHEKDSDETTADSKANKTATQWKTISFVCSKKNLEGNTYNLKISCWNVGGLRSWLKKGCLEYLEHEKPDMFCLQETKCNASNIPEEIQHLAGYHKYWCSSEKEGYAGVGLLTKLEPLHVQYGINHPELDKDGRCITAEYSNYYLVCAYVPNAGRGLVTLPKRLEWNKVFKDYILSLDSRKPVIVTGDMNVSHQEIDLARPKNNTKNAGFTPEEREGMTDFLSSGFVDTFRELYPDKIGAYTFWSYMMNARGKDIGWRLDYFIISERLKEKVCDCVIRKEILGSDHCPITLFINM